MSVSNLTKRSLLVALALSGIFGGALAAEEPDGDTTEEQRQICASLLVVVAAPKMLEIFSDEQVLSELCNYTFSSILNHKRGTVIAECDKLRDLFRWEAFDQRGLDKDQYKVMCEQQLRERFEGK